MSKMDARENGQATLHQNEEMKIKKRKKNKQTKQNEKSKEKKSESEFTASRLLQAVSTFEG